MELSSKDDEHELSAFDEITDSSYLRTEGVPLGPKFAAERAPDQVVLDIVFLHSEDRTGKRFCSILSGCCNHCVANFVCHTDTNTVLKDQSLADIYWPDLLVPLDLEMPSSRYQAHDMFTDSRNGWSCMMESSLDSFRNLPFFTMDKNNSIPSVDM